MKSARTAAGHGKQLRRRKNLSTTVFTVFLWTYALVSLYPLLWMLFYSLKNNDEIFVTNPFGPPIAWQFGNYLKAWSQYNVPLYFKNSIIVGVLTVAVTILCALPFVFAVARLRWRLQGKARTMIALGMFIPVQAIMIPVVQTVKTLGLLGSRWSLILPYSGINLAFACMVFYGFFMGIPREMEEAACIDGASLYQTFFHVMVPLVNPATITIAIYVFLAAWNEFILANVLVGSVAKLKTLPLGVLFFQGQFTTDWGSMGATMTIASLPAILVYALFSEQVERAMTIGGAVKG
jgi:raffinose/stachyose/melibiose transport system permease protein